MTVKELIAKLEACEQNAIVAFVIEDLYFEVTKISFSSSETVELT